MPATMALAMLELCFMNPVMFKWNIKIRKAKVSRLIHFHPLYVFMSLSFLI